MSLRDQRQMDVPSFPEGQLDLGKRIEVFLQRQERVGAESRTLSALRDALLPKLVSGELRVAEAERVVGKHV